MSKQSYLLGQLSAMNKKAMAPGQPVTPAAAPPIGAPAQPTVQPQPQGGLAPQPQPAAQPAQPGILDQAKAYMGRDNRGNRAYDQQRFQRMLQGYRLGGGQGGISGSGNPMSV